MAHYRVDWGDGTVIEVARQGYVERGQWAMGVGSEWLLNHGPSGFLDVDNSTLPAPANGFGKFRFSRLEVVAQSPLQTLATWNIDGGGDAGGWQFTYTYLSPYKYRIGYTAPASFMATFPVPPSVQFNLTERGPGIALPDLDHTYRRPGTFTVRVSAVDPDGTVAEDLGTQTVTVLSPPMVLTIGASSASYSM